MTAASASDALPGDLLAPGAGGPWHGRARTARAEELSALTGALRRAGTVVEEDVPTVVFVYPGLGVGQRHCELSGCTNQLLLLSTAHARLGRLGVRAYAASTEPAANHAHLTALRDRIAVVSPEEAARLPFTDQDDGRYLLRTTFVLGGPRNGLVIEEIDDSVEHTQAVIGTMITDRVRQWEAVAGRTTRSDGSDIEFYPNGADSYGITAFGAGPALVAKTGPRDVILAESDFTGRVNQILTAAGHPVLFPRSWGTLVEGEQATALMERVDPRPLDQTVFRDEACWETVSTAMSDLEGHLGLLDNLYRATWRPESPGVARYLYRDRFPAIVAHPGFRSAVAELLPGWDTADLLGAKVLLPGGAVVAGWTAATTALAGHTERLVPDGGSLIHGDPHLRNLLRRDDGGACLVDPRTVWDGHRREDAGFADPAYDAATLLHSVFPMSAVLHAVDRNDHAGLLPALPGAPGPVLDLSGLALPSAALDGVRDLEQVLVTHLLRLPRTGTPEVYLARLRVGAANALAGWLKYARSLPDARTWLAVYGYTVWYLDRALSALAPQESR
ncbi:phosphotransferase [Kineosporia sp. J2-2]|uniref:Phosphotransferase n=1 Tax=Kineosporia corallincola TaxID=2835133 RepID=A0ABS5TS07_9ACTN|nr:phosphotransferase [Kineosporia corallincola]MBT0773592.1 phosphotransferase [Kineosporia corallincola]